MMFEQAPELLVGPWDLHFNILTPLTPLVVKGYQWCLSKLLSSSAPEQLFRACSTRHSIEPEDEFDFYLIFIIYMGLYNL